MLFSLKWSYFSCSRIVKEQRLINITLFQDKHHLKAPHQILSFEQVPYRLLDALQYLAFVHLRIKKVETKL